jgi:hypothetical protein
LTRHAGEQCKPLAAWIGVAVRGVRIEVVDQPDRHGTDSQHHEDYDEANASSSRSLPRRGLNVHDRSHVTMIQLDA